MNINYLIELLSNRILSLNLAKDQAFSSGDLERINNLDIEIISVQDTLAKLKLLQDASQQAEMTNRSLVEAMKIKSNIITNGSLEVLSNYDISSYATDPLHEQKIADILMSMGPMIDPNTIDLYIDSEAISSPITGQMILSSAQAYEVDVRLMMALMELDSRFGTAGIAVRTLNPGNVGNNDDGEIKIYESWQEGVMAVARWLDRHRISLKEEELPEKIELTEEILDEETEEVAPPPSNINEEVEVSGEVIESPDLINETQTQESSIDSESSDSGLSTENPIVSFTKPKLRSRKV